MAMAENIDAITAKTQIGKSITGSGISKIKNNFSLINTAHINAKEFKNTKPITANKNIFLRM
ncbi:MAG: hypothetical protein KAI27_04155, partial [Rhodospirillaceae bacterium]|nr:hypothetical protein [Rhodospirillaceae bacterium]